MYRKCAKILILTTLVPGTINPGYQRCTLRMDELLKATMKSNCIYAVVLAFLDVEDGNGYYSKRH